VLKERVKKDYRIPAIDIPLRKTRTKSEANILRKLYGYGFPVPKVISCDEKQEIIMEYIPGEKLRDVLSKKNFKKICNELGKKIRQLHDFHIIHGDLTTSNFIVRKKGQAKGRATKEVAKASKKDESEIYFIDFGLSFYSHKIEDKAVDLHLLRQALESKHYQFWEQAFKDVVKAYGDAEVMKRLEQVEMRGRNKWRGS
jgi:Kae1-associated kinase Bud32